MKKIICSLIFILNIYCVFAQININEAISLLDNPVPENFNRLQRLWTSVNDNFYGYSIYVEERNNIVVLSWINTILNTRDEVNSWLKQFHDIVENQNWTFYNRDSRLEIYEKDGIYFIFTFPVFSEGKYSISVYFTRDWRILW